ncbi:universal stress protein [Thiobacillus denitrificans]|uniref:universal stress protein n=1 Tax=Thiobacillus denitrificans TaxID=36861 RepID=UPI00037200D8|nr:universal stress protein [Thiobacillus denitrificans]
MKTHQRILVPFTHGHSGSALLRRAGEIAAAGEIELLVVSVLDTRSGFDLDGPAGNLPDERAARLAPAEQKRLDHDLLRHGLGRARATVIWGEPRAALSALIRSWRPDMIVCDGRTRRMLPARTGNEGPQMMRVDRTGAFARLAGFFFPPAQGHA